MGLLKKKCVPCKGDEPALRPEEIEKLKPELPGWEVTNVENHPSLVKTFKFKDFASSIHFVNQVKDIAESEGHHPDLHIHWDTVRVENWTHATGGLHANDFILAAKIDKLE